MAKKFYPPKPSRSDPDTQAPVKLEYRTVKPPEPVNSRPAWATLVIIAYVLIVLGILAWAIYLLYSVHYDAVPLYQYRMGMPQWYWINLDWIPLLLAAFCVPTILGPMLLVIPFQRSRNTPVRRGTIVMAILSSAAMLAMLTYGIEFALEEFCRAKWDDKMLVAAVLVGLLWPVPFLVEVAVNRKCIRHTWSWLHRSVIAASTIELCITFPVHVIVLRRNEWFWPGMQTGPAVYLGIATLLAALGPTILLLYYKRPAANPAK